jgi:tetratricopeptide (TPR) repeat protein/tRNA A-37 threonylcarbamoyl transferase component Bud32
MSQSDHQTGSFGGSVSDLSVEQALLLDEACNAFEAKWRSGGRPDILAALLELPEALHPVALRELVQLDIHYRRKSGTPATAEDYRRWFPQLDPAELAAFLASHSRSSTRSDGRAEPPSTGPYESFGDYELFEELGRGGMGIVYRARDKRLNRVVAVKFLQPQYAAEALAARRFLDEATITGQLQHLGIPPVHEVGELPNGQPFIAMKLISGWTLADLLADGSIDRGALVAAFEQICQVVAYAHAQGVIHRDLKPANVMVGTFGEVQVMDWGLAKVRAGAGTETAEVSAADTFHDPLSAADEHAWTRTGCLLGTPAYMAPEAALGAIDQVDERSDVFGLGGILCAILTGQPPFVAPTFELTRQLSAQKKLGDTLARLDACGADRKLVAICKGCLAAERGDRPRNAGAVADALQSYRVAAEERARRAELNRVRAEGERAKAELQVAEQRKHREVQLALLAAVLLLLLSAVGAAWWRQTKSLRQQLAGALSARLACDAAAASVRECELALAAGRVDQAALALADADRRMPEGGAAELRMRVERCRADLAILSELNRIDDFRWTPVENKLPEREKKVEQWRAAFEKFGVVPGVTPAVDARWLVADSHVRDRLLTGLHLWLVWDPSPGLRELLAQIDPDGYRESFRDAVAAGDEARMAGLTGRKEALNQPPWFAAVLGQSWGVSVDRRREILEVAARARPSDLVLLMELGRLDPNNHTREGAERRLQWLQAAVAAHPEFAVAHRNLGVALYDTGDVDGAIACYREAIRLDPKFVNAHYNLGVARRDKGELDKAIASFKEALRIERNPRSQDELNQVLWWRGLLPHLPDVIAGRERPATANQACEFGYLCGQPSQKRYAAGVRLYAAAFAADPKQVPLFQYDAARQTILVSAGRDTDFVDFGVEEWGALTDRARTWLRADLRNWAELAKNPQTRSEVRQNLARWKWDRDLAPVRDPAWLAAMAPGDRKAWEAFWSDVDATLAALAPVDAVPREDPKPAAAAKPVDLGALRATVEAAAKRGQNVSEVRKSLDAFEKTAPKAGASAVPPELQALRNAVEAANRKGADVEAIAKELAAVETAVAGRSLANDPIAAVAGEWKVTYTHDVVREYKIDKDGRVTFEEVKLKGQIKRKGPALLLEFAGDDRLERLTLGADGRLFVEHYNPKGDFPDGQAKHIGIGVRQK